MTNEEIFIGNDFIKKFISEQVDLEPEFQKVVDDHFWELLEE